jgi:hypothetical protein
LRFKDRLFNGKPILAKLISTPNLVIKRNPEGTLTFGKHILEQLLITIEINDSGPIISMNDMNLGLGLDLNVRLLTDSQVFQLKERGLASLHACDQTLDLLVLVADVVRDLFTLVEV